MKVLPIADCRFGRPPAFLNDVAIGKEIGNRQSAIGNRQLEIKSWTP
jgi:hypothetical protein